MGVRDLHRTMGDGDAVTRPVAPSARKAADAAARLTREETRLTLELDATEKRSIKVRAAQLGLTVKAYLLGLAAHDGCAGLPPIPVALIETADKPDP